MGVYFVYRSGYENPLGHRLESFEDLDMLTWFQRNWLKLDDIPPDLFEWSTCIDGSQYLEIDYEFLARRTDSILGRFVYGFDAVWTSMAQNPLPQSNSELVTWLESIDYPEGEVLARRNAFQAATGDDERDLRVMMFDSSFAEENPNRVALFLHNDLELPTKSSPVIGEFNWLGKSEVLNSLDRLSKSTYCIFVVLEDTAWLSPPKGVFQFAGIDLKSLAGELRQPVEFNHAQWPSELRMLRSLAFRYPEMNTQELLEVFIESEPFDNASLFDSWQSGECFERYLLGDSAQVNAEFSGIAERFHQRIDPDNKNHSSQFSDNLVRIGYHVEDSDSFRNSYHLAMYFFDDLWARANADLATSLLHYGSDGMCLFERGSRPQ